MPGWLAWMLRRPVVERFFIDGEEEVDTIPRHWVAYTRPLVLGLLALVVLLVVFPLSPIELGWFWLLCVLVSVVWAVVLAAVRRRDVFVVTNKRVMRFSGLPSLTTTVRASIPITRILDITVHQPVLGQVLGYGHLVFESAAQVQGLREIRYVPHVDERELTIQTELDRRAH